MNCFGELFVRYREKLYDLLEQECFDEDRDYCGIPEPDDRDCILCSRHSFGDGRAWSEICRTCDSEECRSLWAWIIARGKDGSKRRLALKNHFGRSIFDIPHAMRREAILTAMLTTEAKDARLRVAA